MLAEPAGLHAEDGYNCRKPVARARTLIDT